MSFIPMNKLVSGIGLVGIALLLFGCVGLRSGEMYVKDITNQKLGFIKPGKTTKEEVLQELGIPTMTAADGRMLGYRFTLYKSFHHTPDSYGLWVSDPELAAATPSYAVQIGQNGSLRCDYGYLMHCHEAIFIFDGSSRLRQYRLFKPFKTQTNTE